MAENAPLTEPGVRETALHEWHVRAGARMTVFAGWSMPLYYSSILSEHMQVRRRTGLFDVSHMGRFTLRGAGAQTTLERLTPSSLGGLAAGQAKYSLLLNPAGGIKDDFIIYKQGEDDFLLVVNAGNALQDHTWIREHLLQDAQLEDLSRSTCLVALQGPLSERVLEEAGGCLADGTSLAALKPFHFGRGRVADVPAVIMRTGYTGESGVELMMDCDRAQELWTALLPAGEPGTVLPCGLGARDTLRLEAGFLLHGLDMDESTTPFEAGLGWLVNLDKGPFLGKEALEAAKAAGPGRLLVGLGSRQRAIPRSGDRIFSGGEAVGQVTSGTFSPVLNHPLALGYVRPELAAPGTALQVAVRGRTLEAEVVKRPFYKSGVTHLPPEPAEKEAR